MFYTKCLILVFYLLCSLAQKDLTIIRIERLSFSDLCIQGNLFVDDDFIGYSLELPAVGNNENVSSIPSGKYAAKVRNNGTKGWRLELEYADRSFVQIHIGNTRDESRGCILVGKNADSNTCTLSDSADAMKLLKDKFYRGGNAFTKAVVVIE